MKAALSMLLAAAFLLGVLAVDASRAGAAADGAKAAPETGADAPKTDVPDTIPTDADLAKGLKEVVEEKKAEADEADDAEKPTAPKRRLTPYERTLQQAKTLVDNAAKQKAKIPAIEAKVNAKVAKLTDSAKNPVEVRTLQQELAENRLTRASKTYRDLNLAVAREYEKVKAMLFMALKNCLTLGKMKAPDEDTKVRGEALTASIKEECVDVLTKLAGLYERVSDTAKVTACYQQILAVDRENAAARTYFKELKEREKEGNSGGGSHIQYERGDRGRRR